MMGNDMNYRLQDIVFEKGGYWVLRVPSGFEVYRNGITHSVRCATIGYSGDEGLQRAKAGIERRSLVRSND